jgi:hypothetical protein
MGSTVDFPKDEAKLIKGLAEDEANMVRHARQHFCFPVRCGEVAGINATNTKSTHIGSDLAHAATSTGMGALASFAAVLPRIALLAPRPRRPTTRS